MKIDVTSDLHFDSWVKPTNPEYQQEKQFEELFEKIIPDEASDVLCIAGDLGHYNEQNEFALRILASHYQYVLLCSGNHDQYLISNSQAKIYNHDSLNRLKDMKERCDKTDWLHFLDGEIFQIEDKKFFGGSLWYDFQYGIQNFGFSTQQLIEYWKGYMADSSLIRINNSQINNLEYFKSEYEKLKSNFQECDFIMTHVGPDWSRLEDKYRNPGSSFFYFDGENILRNCQGKTWLYGHTHSSVEFEKYGCKLICNPLGYKHENIIGNDLGVINYKFKTIEI